MQVRRYSRFILPSQNDNIMMYRTHTNYRTLLNEFHREHISYMYLYLSEKAHLSFNEVVVSCREAAPCWERPVQAHLTLTTMILDCQTRISQQDQDIDIRDLRKSLISMIRNRKSEPLLQCHNIIMYI